MFSFTPATLITRAIVLLVAMTVHEFAHAYGAYRMGDTTAKDMGRMTLNPAANINLYGYIFGVLTGFGILGSAPVNQYRMRDPRWGMFVAVLAGPVSNLLIAALFAVSFRFGLLEPQFVPGTGINLFFPSIQYVMTEMIWLNIILFVFNILPFYPLDGWTVVLALLPPRQAIWWQRYQRENMYVGFGLLLLSMVGLGVLNPLHWLVSVPTEQIFRALIGWL